MLQRLPPQVPKVLNRSQVGRSRLPALATRSKGAARLHPWLSESPRPLGVRRWRQTRPQNKNLPQMKFFDHLECQPPFLAATLRPRRVHQQRHFLHNPCFKDCLNCPMALPRTLQCSPLPRLVRLISLLRQVLLLWAGALVSFSVPSDPPSGS